jgi:hypothetical protein
VPFSQLRFTGSSDQVWGLNIHRYIPELNEDDYWVPVPRTVTAWASRFGELGGIQGVQASQRLELLPYTAAASSIKAQPDPANPFAGSGSRQGRVGADVKVGVGSNLTLDATINPDCGQVEADPAEVNLSGVETPTPSTKAAACREKATVKLKTPYGLEYSPHYLRTSRRGQGPGHDG